MERQDKRDHSKDTDELENKDDNVDKSVTSKAAATVRSNGTEKTSNVITSLSAKRPIFHSWGIANIKATYGHDEQQILHIAIQSVDVTSIQQDLAGFRPQPVKKRAWIGAKTPEGVAAGLVRDGWYWVEDIADIDYQRKVEDYTQEIGYSIVLQGLRCDLFDTNDELVWQHNGSTRNRAAAVQSLKDSGITTSQFASLMNQIQDLTRVKEEEQAGNFGEV